MTTIEHLSAEQPSAAEAPDRKLEHERVRDPVCGMMVDPAASPHRAEHAGHAYHFCSSSCREQFIADPAHYLAPVPAATASPVASAASWTCPMHPQIVRDGPGSCPICGMALEPMTPSAGDAANPELRDMTRRFWVGVALSLPLLALGDGPRSRAGGVRRADFAARRGMARAHSRDPGGAVVRRAVFPARLGLAGQPPAQHVHPDRARHRHRLWLQPGRGTAAGDVSAVVPHAGRRRAGLFRAGGGHRHPGAARPGARVARPRPDRRRDPRASRSRAQGRPPGARRWRRGRHSARSGGSRQPLAGAARREGAGRRHRARRQERHRRIDADRRADAGRKGGRRPGHRGHPQHHRQLHHARRAGRQRDLARPDRAHGRRGAALARPDPGAGRHRLRLVRAGRHPRRGDYLCRLVDLRAGAGGGICAGQRGRGADRRLPVRARPGDADVDHGRHRARRPRRGSGPQRASARIDGKGRHPGRRQDRNLDPGQAAPGRNRRRPAGSTRTSCCTSPPASSAAASTRWPRPSSRAPKSAG